MKVLFIADGRSDHTVRWVTYFTSDFEVILMSTYKCNPIQGVTIVVLPGIFRLTTQLTTTKSMDVKQKSISSKLLSILIQSKLASDFWGLFKLMDLFSQVLTIKSMLRDFQPDVVHAMRIQNEGYIAAFSGIDNFILSSWGSDFILTAESSFVHRILTRITMKKTQYFMSDCMRDQKLAVHFGMSNHASKYIFPGNGGVDKNIFYPLDVPCKTLTILYCRGLSYLSKIDTLFESMALLKSTKKVYPSITILASRTTHGEFFECARRFGINQDNITIKDYVAPIELAQIMRNTSVFVSPLISDGVPNSMLEAMACGMIPVMSDLDSIREHITNNKNGFLFDPASPQSLALALERAFSSLNSNFRFSNTQTISDSAEYNSCLDSVKTIYADLAKNNEALRK